MTENSLPVIKTENLGKRYKKRWAVNHLNLEVLPGDIFGFLGPNGAGKSTTIRMLLSLIAPTTGRVDLFGSSLNSNRSAALSKIGGIVEKPDFYLYLSAVKNLEIAASLFNTVNKKRIYELLDLVGLGSRAHDKVKTYSHGMKQRLGIAQSLLSDPSLVILDEPTNGLDPAGMKEVRDLIMHLSRDQHKTIFLSSHILSEIELVATRMAIINKGELVVQGNVKGLLEDGEQRVVINAQPVELTRSILVSASQICSAIQCTDTTFSVAMSRDNVPLLTKKLVENGVHIYSIVPKRSLEDYFLTITETSADVN
jgi:ABC-2 type transport system ATP-binding protein